MGDLLDDYLSIIREFTDAPDIFLQSNAYHMISTTLGQFFKIYDSHIERPNLWFILSSIPGRTRRSTVISYNEQLISRAFTRFYEEIENISRREAYNKYGLSRIVDGSAEGIADKVMEGENQGVNIFNICNPEIGDVLRKISKEYGGSTGVDTLLSRLYYGEGYHADFSSRTRNPGPRTFSKGKYVTMFSSMQEPGYYLNKTMSRQGLLRRFLLVYVDAKDLSMDSWKSPFVNNLHEYQKKLDDYLESQLLPIMLEYHEAWKNYNENKPHNSYIPVKIDKEVLKKIGKIAYEVDKKIIEDDSDYHIYQQTQWESLTKMTVVSAIARNPLKGDNEQNMWCTFAYEEDFQRAKDILDVIGKHTEQILEDLGTQEIKLKRDKGLDRVYKQILKAGKNGIKRSALLNNLFGIKAKELDEYIETLAQAGKIKTLRPGNNNITKYIATACL